MAAIAALPVVLPVRAAAPRRTAARAARAPVAAAAAPLRLALGAKLAPRAPKRARAVIVRAMEEKEAETEEMNKNGVSKETSKMMEQIFGSNLQVAVWVTTLSFAAYTAYQTNDPAESGLLIAPPTAAVFLILSFFAFYFVYTGQRKAKNEDFKARREAEEAEALKKL